MSSFSSALPLRRKPCRTVIPADYQKTVATAKKEGRLVIYSTTDSKATGPLLKGFAARYPQIKVEYNDINSTELYNRYISEQAAGGTSGDVIWSSSMDTALKLASDYALPYASVESGKIPPHGRYGNKRPTAPPMNRWCLSTTSALSNKTKCRATMKPLHS